MNEAHRDRGSGIGGLLRRRSGRLRRGRARGIARTRARIYARVDPGAFGIARPLDAGHIAITPAVRRGYVRLPNDRLALSLGDAHIVMDPITGQGANRASRDAFVLGEAIRDADAFDDAFCEEVERRVCDYAIPISDACNARLQPPPSHVGQLLGAAAQHHAVADLYGSGFHYPDRLWRIISSPERTPACSSGSKSTA